MRCLLGMSSILSKSRFSRNIINQMLLLPPSPCPRMIPSNSRNYSRGADTDSVKNIKNISKIAIWSSIGVCSVAFFAFQTGYLQKIIDKSSHFRQIIDNKGYSDKIIDTNHHDSRKFANKDDTDLISVDVASRDGVKPSDKFGEDSNSLASIDSDSVSSSSEGKLIHRRFEEDSIGGDDSDLSESVVDSSDGSDIKDGEITIMPSPHLHAHVEDTQQENTGRDGKEHNSFVDEYYLREGEKGTTDSNLKVDKKEPVLEIKEMEGVVNSEEKWVLGFIEAIHAAEKRQADLDAQAFHKEKEILKDWYQNALADSKAKELMYAEEVEILDKELFQERVKSEEAMKACRDEAEAKFKMEAEQKEKEAELKMKRLVELGEAELIAAVISEKASQLKKIEEASLHINALCMAFYAQNTEAQQIQSVHKLALWAHAVEDSLSNGLPVKDVDGTCYFLEGKDTVVDLVMLSLSKDVWSYGTHDLSHLHQKLEGLKGVLRLHNLIPHGGGGFLTHSVARIASLLKVKEKDGSGDGIESAMNKAQRLLLQGKLCEAADTLEEATRGTQAAQVIIEWVKCVRNRAIIEQAVAFLKSYATSISLHNM